MILDFITLVHASVSVEYLTVWFKLLSLTMIEKRYEV